MKTEEFKTENTQNLDFETGANARPDCVYLGGGGGNPLIARVLACLGIAKPFVLCVLDCFNIAKSFELCFLCCFNKLSCHPELVSGSIQSIDNKIINNTKLGITPHLILQKNKFFAKSSSPTRGEDRNPNGNRRDAFALTEGAMSCFIRSICQLVSGFCDVEKMEDNLCIKI